MKRTDIDWCINEFMPHCRSVQLRPKTMASYEHALRLFGCRCRARVKRETERINMAQQGIGRGTNQGNIWQRGRSGLRIFSMLITWSIDSLVLTSESMRSRGAVCGAGKPSPFTGSITVIGFM